MNNDERDKLIQETHTAVTVIAEKVGRHDKTLYGNGRPGLCERLQQIEDRHVHEDGSSKRWVTWIAAIAAVIAAWTPFLIALMKK